MRGSCNHVEQREYAIKGVPYDYYALFRSELGPSDPLWVVALDNPYLGIDLALAGHSHVL